MLAVLKEEYTRQGWVTCSRGRISRWYTDMREKHPFLRQTVSYVSLAVLVDLGLHYAQYVECERLKAAGETLKTEFAEPRFRKSGDPVYRYGPG